VNVGEKFCKECGNPMPKPGLTECPQCKAPLATDAKFCSECGYKTGSV